MRTIRIVSLNTMASAVLLLFSVDPVFGQPQTQICESTDQSTEQVIPGVVLMWDSSFHCRNAPDTGEYMIVVRVFNASDSAEKVTIENLELSHTTPRAGGEGPVGTADPSGLPITVKPGETKDFTVTGLYELIETDEGRKANLHLRAAGAGLRSSEPFALGINVLIRDPGTED